MPSQTNPFITEEVYLRGEQTGSVKHEYYAGKIYAMSGSSEEHNLIAGDLLAAIRPQLRGRPCRIYPSDMRVKVVKTGLQTYPDLSIICSTPQFTPTNPVALTNPTVLVEILSESTERYDRGFKSQNYRMIDTLQEYLLVSQDQYHIEHYIRQPDGRWLLAEVSGLAATLRLESIQCDVMMVDVYEQVELSGEQPVDLPRTMEADEG